MYGHMPTQSLGKCANLVAIIFRKPSGEETFIRDCIPHWARF